MTDAASHRHSPDPPASGAAAGAAADGCQPRIWLVLSDKGGDNGQVEVVAQGLERAFGWRCTRRHVQMQADYVTGKPRTGASLHHIDPARSDALEPPWPDLILTIGRRSAMAALWVREQSGGHSKIVLIGKPHGRVERYDLIVVSRAENALPPMANLLPISLPLMRVPPDALAAAAEAWGPRLAALPRPLVGVLVGGPNVHYRYTGALVGRLLAAAREIVATGGGTPFVTTSRRTPEAIVAALREGLPARAQLYAWRPGAEDNPYRGLLAHADGLIVTADSISMMVEAVQAGKPLAICPVPTGPFGTLDAWRRSFVHALFALDGAGLGAELRRTAARLLYRLGLVEQTRDFRAFQRMLLDAGLAVPLGRPFNPPGRPPPDDLPLILARIRALAES